MLGKAKDFMVKKLLKSQLKNVPKEQQEMIMTMVEKDPKLFEKISKEIKAEMKNGSDQMAASMKVMPKYQAQLQKLMGNQAHRGGGQQFNPNGSIHK